MPFTSARRFFAVSRRSFAARPGFVELRFLGRMATCRIRATRRALAASRFRPCVRCSRLSRTSTPSVVMRLPASTVRRGFDVWGKRRDPAVESQLDGGCHLVHVLPAGPGRAHEPLIDLALVERNGAGDLNQECSTQLAYLRWRRSRRRTRALLARFQGSRLRRADRSALSLLPAVPDRSPVVCRHSRSSHAVHDPSDQSSRCIDPLNTPGRSLLASYPIKRSRSKSQPPAKRAPIPRPAPREFCFEPSTNGARRQWPQSQQMG